MEEHDLPNIQWLPHYVTDWETLLTESVRTERELKYVKAFIASLENQLSILQELKAELEETKKENNEKELEKIKEMRREEAEILKRNEEEHNGKS